MSARHFHLVARHRSGRRRLVAFARDPALIWRWRDRWAEDFARRGELLSVQAVAGPHTGCGRDAADEEGEGA